MEENRLNSKDLRTLGLWILAGIVGLIFAWKYFFVAFPEASLDMRIDRSAAVEKARDFLAQQGFPTEGYETSVVFDLDDNAKTYLERELKLEQANRLMASEVNVWYWSVRFFRPRQQEEFSVHVDPGGRVVGIAHVVEEAREGAKLERDAAYTIAENFLREGLRADLAAYEPLPQEANSKDLPKRRDWNFTWERRGFKAKDAPYRLRVTIQGDRVGGYSEFLKVPEAWERDFARLRSSNELYQWLGQVPYGFLQFGAVLSVLYFLHLRGQVRWGGALKFGLVLALLFFLMLANEWPVMRATYDTNSDYVAFLLGRFVLGAGGALFLGMIVSLTVAAGEPLYRRDHPEKLRLGIGLTGAGIRSKEFFKSCVIGLAMAAAHLGFVVAFYVIGQQVSSDFWVPQEVKYTNAVSTVAPWIYPLAISIYAATSEEFLFRLFAIPYLLRLTKSPVVAVVLPAFVWGFLHSAYPVQPGWARGVEVGIIGVVAGWVMLRWGIWATLVWHYTVDAMLIGLFLLRSESLYFKLSGAFVGGAVLLPLAVAAVAYLSRRRFSDEDAILNRAQPVEYKEVEAPPAPRVTGRVYDSLSPQWLGVLLVIGLAGAGLAVAVQPKAIGSFVRFAVTPRQASALGDEALRARRVDSSTYKRTVAFASRFDPYANEYLRRQAGIDGANQLYQEKVPAAFWRVRYFRDSEKEEWAVIVRVDGGLHAVRHTIDEKAAGANLLKEEALARAQAWLRDEKKLDLAQWKLVRSDSQKRDARTDHEFEWEDSAAVGEAHARVELQVLGDEVTSYRVFVKIPEEWERKQKETGVGDIAFLILRGLAGLGLVILCIVIFVKTLKQTHVPWRRLAGWAAWPGLAFLLTLALSWGKLLENYPTAVPLRTFSTILVLAQFLIVAFVYSGFLFLFALAWVFLAKAFGEERLPAWRGMPALYYRDAFLMGLAGIGTFIGLSRVRVFVERMWPTDYDSFGIGVPQALDILIPAGGFLSSAVTNGMFQWAVIAIAAGLMALYVKERWMQAVALIAGAILLGGSTDGAANFAKGTLLSLITLVVVWIGVTRFFRFNLLGYFLTGAGIALAGGAAQLLRQPAPFFQQNGYAVVAMLVLLFAWPLGAWLRGGNEPVPSRPPSL